MNEKSLLTKSNRKGGRNMAMKRIKSLWLARALIAKGYNVVDTDKEGEDIVWYFNDSTEFNRTVGELIDANKRDKGYPR